MYLMFFIGGLFLHKSIIKKEFKNFLEDRFYRLFVPFIISGTIYRNQDEL
jgi:glucan biosynthesis protein C